MNNSAKENHEPKFKDIVFIAKIFIIIKQNKCNETF